MPMVRGAAFPQAMKSGNAKRLVALYGASSRKELSLAPCFNEGTISGGTIA